MIVLDILYNLLWQFLVTAGLIIFMGAYVALGNHLFYKVAADKGKIATYVTGFIGVPIHELSHAFMCVVFWHKITKIKLYQIKSDDNTLGYVEHTYNPKNIYQQIGCFFIGTAPIVCGSVILMLLLWGLVPQSFVSIIALTDIGVAKVTFASLFGSVENAFYIMFAAENFSNILWWVYSFLALTIVLHMNLSKEDISNSWKGLLFYIGILLLVNIIFALVSKTEMLTVFMYKVGVLLIMVFEITAIYILILVFAAYALKYGYKALKVLIKKIAGVLAKA